MTERRTFPSPIGDITLTATGDRLTGLYLPSHRGQESSEPGDSALPVLLEAERQLTEYFAGTRREFDLPLAPEGTAFQLRVWEELARIPYGETISYGELARRLGDPNASRAVGLANGRNPISIVVPCHRVIGANGKLVGYGGGIEAKAHLLDHERGLFSV